jgi:pectate lyase
MPVYTCQIREGAVSISRPIARLLRRFNGAGCGERHRACLALAILLVLAGVALPGPGHAEDAAAQAHAVVDAGLAAAHGAEEATRAAAARRCQGPDEAADHGLTVTDDHVVKARLLGEIDGAARAAGTTGGLNGQVYVVTSAGDYLPRLEEKIPGSLRAAVDESRLSRNPAWIVFDRTMTGKTIELKSALRPGDDVTLDARCAGVTLIAKAEIPLIILKDHRNVVVTGFAMRKFPYSGENKGRDDGKDFRDCVTVSGNVDALAFLHNDFGACGDGQIDMTGGVGKNLPTMGGRITIAFNRFGKHDKAMLLGTYGCDDASRSLAQGCSDLASLGGARPVLPAYRVTFQGNLFLWTGQRNPRLYGLVWSQAVDNVYAFEPYDRGNGTSGAAYGQYVADGAMILSEDNVYVGVAPPGHVPLGLYTVNSPGAVSTPGDVEGLIASRGNIWLGDMVVAENRPEIVLHAVGAGPGKDVVAPGGLAPLVPREIDVKALGIDGAIACIAARAGAAGGDRWMPQFCHTAD